MNVHGVVELTADVFHVRAPHGRELDRKSARWLDREEVDSVLPPSMVLLPRVPRVGDPTREDDVTPRVCFARTIGGAVTALGLSGKVSEFYVGVYVPERPIEVFEPFSSPEPGFGNRFYVWDAAQNGEVWSLRPVRAELSRVVRPGEPIA